jgi:hypothetical protein
MPAIYQSREATKGRPGMVANRTGEIIASKGLVIPSAQLAANDVLESVILPADHIPVDLILDTDDMDGAAGMTLDVGFMTGLPGVADSARTVGQEFAAALTTAQAGGVARLTLLKAFRISPVGYDRSIGVKIAVVAATPVAPIAASGLNRGAWQPNTAYALNDYVVLPDGRRLKCTTAGTSQGLPTSPTNLGGLWLPPTLAPTAYAATQADGTVTWTMADMAVGITLLSRFGRAGA